MLPTGVKVEKNNSKLSTNSAAELKSYGSADFFNNMLVDVKTTAYQNQYALIRSFLTQEFGQRYNFSDSFVDKVIEKINNN